MTAPRRTAAGLRAHNARKQVNQRLRRQAHSHPILTLDEVEGLRTFRRESAHNEWAWTPDRSAFRQDSDRQEMIKAHQRRVAQ